MTVSPVLTTLVSRARRRAFWNLVWEQTSVGLAAAMAGLILLLLVGTDVLDWWWPLLLFVVGTGIAAWRTMQSLPAPYSVAQAVDQRLNLRDTLSTAIHFSQPGAADKRSQVFLDAQQESAERLASGVQVGDAMPWRMPRQLYIAGGLLAAGATLFLVRYGIHGTLDLRAPIIEAVADFFHPTREVTAQNKQRPRRPGEDPLAIPIDRPGEEGRKELENAPEDALSVVDTPDVNAGVDTKDQARAKQSDVKAQGDQAGDEMEEGDQKGEKSGPDGGKEGGDQKGGSPDQGDKQGPQNAKQGNSEQNSMMDKMRDAMASLLNKMKIPNQGQQQQRASNQKGQEKGQGEKSGKGQKGEKGQGQQQGKGAPSDDPEADAQGEQQAQSGQGKSNDKSADSGTPTEAKSGMGKQDGSKDIKDAEQLAAMGKLSEIFGKRAQNMTGDVMVEVSNGKQQQLRTAYSQRNAAHREAGGEIHRDEVPIEYQHYVQQYFDQVRKGEKPVGVAERQEPASAQPK